MVGPKYREARNGSRLLTPAPVSPEQETAATRAVLHRIDRGDITHAEARRILDMLGPTEEGATDHTARTSTGRRRGAKQDAS